MAHAVTATLGYIWAAPCSLIGILLSIPALMSGASARAAGGVIEIAGGRFLAMCSRGPIPFRFAAIALGHVILGSDDGLLDTVRPHELVHVRQYERWGPLLIPLYILSSLSLRLRNRDPYLENRFEKEAFAEAGPGLGHPGSS